MSENQNRQFILSAESMGLTPCMNQRSGRSTPGLEQENLDYRSSSRSVNVTPNKSTLSALGVKLPKDTKSEKCVHNSHSSLKKVQSLEPITTEYYRRHLQRYRAITEQSGGDTAQINGQLNEIFVKRLEDIDANASGDLDLKLVTYQEWVDMLLKINENIIGNMEDLESAVAERIQQSQLKNEISNKCRQQQAAELDKYKRDVCLLLKVIRNGYQHDDWNLNCMKFETLTHSQVLGVNDNQHIEGGASSPQVAKQQLRKQNEALSLEVTKKHEELRVLRTKLLHLDDEMQTAQWKLDLKENAIRELRAQVTQAHARIFKSYIIKFMFQTIKILSNCYFL